MIRRIVPAAAGCAGLLCLAATAADTRTPRSTRADDPPYAMPGTATAPQLFGDGVISTRDVEQNASFTPDGRTVYFTKRSIWPAYASVICESRWANGRWGEPAVVPFSGHDYDADPFVAADGQRLYFASNRPVDDRAHRDRDIWYVVRTTTGWGEPQRLPAPVNSTADESYPVLVADGSLYFSSSPRGNGATRTDTYRAQWMGDHFDTPQQLPLDDERAQGRLHAYVAPDERFMVFYSIRNEDTRTEAGIYSPGDLYLSERVNGEWQPSRHLGPPINTAAGERAPMGSPDGKYLFFTSERGFATAHPTQATTYEALERHLHQSRNGLGDIYQVPISALGLGKAAGGKP